MGSGEWLEKALKEVCGRMEVLDLDDGLISGLVSFCELAPPADAADYLANIIGPEAAQDIIRGYLQRRGYTGSSDRIPDIQTSKPQPYVKTPSNEGAAIASKKQTRMPKETAMTVTQDTKKQTVVPGPKNAPKENPSVSKKKKSGKVISLAEAAKGSVVFQQGKPCSCQARQHKLVSNCLSCGKIVCEQEGEGPCSFCGALVLKEGSTYAGIEDLAVPLSDAEAAAEAYAKRLVEYDRNAAARTTVIDDQSDYYEIEGNSWISQNEKDLLMRKQKEAEEAKEAQKKRVIVTFDLVGRKVLVNENESSELESEHRILRPSEEREANRIKPNPTVRVQPVFVNTGSAKKAVKEKQNKKLSSGLCLEISGRVQHDTTELNRHMADSPKKGSSSDGAYWQGPSSASLSHEGDELECSLDYN